MDPKQSYGVAFQSIGTAVSTSATATKAMPSGATTIYVTDVAGSSDVGTATITIRNGTTDLWQATMCASSAGGPFTYSFKEPLASTGTVNVIVAGGSNSLKCANFNGYSI